MDARNLSTTIPFTRKTNNEFGNHSIVMHITIAVMYSIKIPFNQ